MTGTRSEPISGGHPVNRALEVLGGTCCYSGFREDLFAGVAAANETFGLSLDEAQVEALHTLTTHDRGYELKEKLAEVEEIALSILRCPTPPCPWPPMD